MGRLRAALAAVAALVLVVSGCQKKPDAAPAASRTIVVTWSVLGAVVKDLVGDAFAVAVQIPNGLDPHEWEPSAKDIEALNKAALIVENGTGFEAGMGKTLAAARAAGVPVFTASGSFPGTADPHLWMDPVSMKVVVDALSARLREGFGVDISARQADLNARLDALDAEIRSMVLAVPEANRRLVTGHESLGWFARRYGFALVGAVIPSLSTQAEVSAGQIASLKKVILQHPVKAVFTELGTPKAVVDALGRELDVKAVGLGTHVLPPDGSYFTFMRDLARLVCDSLR